MPKSDKHGNFLCTGRTLHIYPGVYSFTCIYYDNICDVVFLEFSDIGFYEYSCAFKCLQFLAAFVTSMFLPFTTAF
jgi:hypothetical protein